MISFISFQFNFKFEFWNKIWQQLLYYENFYKERIWWNPLYPVYFFKNILCNVMKKKCTCNVQWMLILKDIVVEKKCWCWKRSISEFFKQTVVVSGRGYVSNVIMMQLLCKIWACISIKCRIASRNAVQWNATKSAKNQVDAGEGRVTLTKHSINGGTTVLKPPLALCNKPGVPPVLINAQRLC